MNNFYVYAHYKPDGNIFYVGKGRGNRAWIPYKRSNFWYKTVHKHGYEVVLLYENLSEEDAFKLEQEEIAFWGRRNNPDNFGFLINLTDGGEGPIGYKFTQEQLNNIDCKQRSESAIKTMSSQDMRNRISTKMMGNINGVDVWKNEERKTAMAKLRTLQWQDEEYRKRNLRARTPRKNYSFVAPDGSVHHVRGRKELCNTYMLDQKAMSDVHNGKIKSHKGWKKYIPPDDTYLLNQFTL
jgi:hypothetical protein